MLSQAKVIHIWTAEYRAPSHSISKSTFNFSTPLSFDSSFDPIHQTTFNRIHEKVAKMRKFMPSKVPMQKFSPAHGHETAYKPSPVDYTEVPPNAHHEFNNENRGQLKAEIHKWKKRVSLLRAFSRAMSTVLNFVMFAFMAFIIGTFLATRHDQALNRNIWPKDPKTWPSIMLLVSSLVTFLLSIFVLCFYCLCFKRASDSWKLIILTYGIHISVWLTVTFLYRWEKALNDLWGWSCTDIAKELQASGQTKVDFSKLCSIQVSFSPPPQI